MIDLSVLDELRSWWESTARVWLSDGFDFLKDGYETLPAAAQSTMQLIFLLAVLGILMSHAKGIWHCRKQTKPRTNSKLHYSYFRGTGDYQRSLAYSSSFGSVSDGTWSWVSFAGLGSRLGAVTNPSRVITFLFTLAYLPIATLGVIEMVIRVLLGGIYLFLTNLIHWLVLKLLHLGNMIFGMAFNVVDRTKRIEQHCLHCYKTFRLPKLQCPQCKVLHRDLVPGPSGIFSAHCQCGSSIPCSIISGRSKLEAACPHCEGELAAANAKQFTVQLVGGDFAGKTSWLAAFQHLYLTKGNSRETLSITGKPVADFQQLETMFTAGGNANNSSKDLVSHNLVHSVRDVGTLNLQINRIQAQTVLNRTFERNPQYLDFTDGLIFMVDPLSVEEVRAVSRELGDAADFNHYPPYDANELFVEFIQLFSAITARSETKRIDLPVAVLVNKVDVRAVKRKIGFTKIETVFAARPSGFRNDISSARDALCRGYLQEIGLGNVINNIDSVFSNVKYFPVSAIGHPWQEGKTFQPNGTLEPMMWIAKEAKAKDLAHSLMTKQASLMRKT